ncbi:MAG: hypothetical protein QOD93_6323 [Acetobacteraceae bacterium]|jgi:hypothetical protein|nr:hypothetical protein [Acetobacteraceae bacterium]
MMSRWPTGPGKSATNYGQRALIETTTGRYKALIGPRLRTRGFAAQPIEAAIGAEVLNGILATGRPKSVRGQRGIA